MYSIKWFENIMFVERVLGLHRTFYDQNKIKQCFVVLQIFVYLSVHTLCFIGYMYLMLGGPNTNQSNYIYCAFASFSYVAGLMTYIIVILDSSAFKSYIDSVYFVIEFFGNDQKLVKLLKNIHWFSLIMIFLSTAFAVVRVVEPLILMAHTDMQAVIFFGVSQSIMRMTYSFQYVQFTVTSMIVVSLSKSLTSLVSTTQSNVGSFDLNQWLSRNNQIENLVELYRHLLNSCQRITKCFGNQFVLLLVLSMCRYILLMYLYLYARRFNKMKSSDYYQKAVVITAHFMVVMMPLVAGQMVTNHGLKIHRILARLHNTLVTDSERDEAKLVKDFIRLIKKNPLQIKLLSNVTSGLIALPIILMFFVNYLIVLLQFNHVL